MQQVGEVNADEEDQKAGGHHAPVQGALGFDEGLIVRLEIFLILELSERQRMDLRRILPHDDVVRLRDRRALAQEPAQAFHPLRHVQASSQDRADRQHHQRHDHDRRLVIVMAGVIVVL